ncbi:MAG: hypothetical protein AB7O66_19185 [Limisphaerales bacterium]
MARLEDITPGALVRGVVPGAAAEVVSVKWHRSDVVETVYKGPAGRGATELLFRDREPTLEIASNGHPWSFDADGRLIILAA